jgi:hypothetical protein
MNGHRDQCKNMNNFINYFWKFHLKMIVLIETDFIFIFTFKKIIIYETMLKLKVKIEVEVQFFLKANFDRKKRVALNAHRIFYIVAEILDCIKNSAHFAP